MISDYYLTILGNKYRKIEYKKHYKTKTYELNPTWVNDIEKSKWFNPKHLIIVVLISLYSIFLSQFEDVRFFNFFLGFIYTLYGSINGRHISNILIFRYLIKKPDDISGEINLTHILVLKSSQYQTIILTFPLLFLTILSPSAFMIGGLLSCVLLFIIHSVWIKKYKNNKNFE